MTPTTRSRWTTGKTLPESPTATIYCFPHSGALPSEFVRWGRELPGVQVYGICAPGRGDRAREPALHSISDFVRSLVEETEFAEPFVFFGHSLGGLTAFETVRALHARGRPLPQRLIVSAHSAPQLGRSGTKLSDLPETELVQTISERYGAIPAEVSGDPQLLALLLPAFRVDFGLLDRYTYEPGPALPLPIDVFGGREDASVSADALTAWSVHTADSFRSHWFGGGHFYFREEPAAVFDTLRTLLSYSTERRVDR